MKKTAFLLLSVALVICLISAKDYDEFKKNLYASNGTYVEIRSMNGSIYIGKNSRDSVFVYCKRISGDESKIEDMQIDILPDSGKIVIEAKGKNPDSDVTADFEILLPESIFVSFVFTANGNITVENVKGDAEMSTFEGDIEIVNFTGPLKVENMNGGISVSGASGLKKIDNMNGDITLNTAEILSDSVIVKTVTGDISLIFASDIGVSCEMNSLNGKISVCSGIKGEIMKHKEGQMTLIMNGGAKIIQVKNTEGNINVKEHTKCK